jgi:hypothetical protein
MDRSSPVPTCTERERERERESTVEVQGLEDKSEKAGRLAPLFILSARFHSFLLNFQNPTASDCGGEKNKSCKRWQDRESEGPNQIESENSNQIEFWNSY